MAEERVQRRLAAILAADVVGYSRLMEADEDGTRARLRSRHSEQIDPQITTDGGRIVKSMGDGILVEFASVVDAVRNALITQTIVSILPGRLEEAGRERAQRKRTENITAYDLVLLGVERYRLLTFEGNAEARDLFRKALELDSQYARAHANLAWTRVADGFLETWNEELLAEALNSIETARRNGTMLLTHRLIPLAVQIGGRPEWSCR